MFQALSDGKTGQLPIVAWLPPPPGAVVGVGEGALVGVRVGVLVGALVGELVGVRVGVAADPLQVASTSFELTRVIESFVPSQVSRNESPAWMVVPELAARAANAPNASSPAAVTAAGRSERFTGNPFTNKAASNYVADGERHECQAVEKKGRAGLREAYGPQDTLRPPSSAMAACRS